ncbi:phage r1t holin [Salana multivorans]|uniref:Phage r1t holin n=1 Tax=Salana multivorans TaxID=120377 RepID=A0A3N2DEC1_9MICO|nr:holin [Salana multivorans]ROR97774.1 r1t family holin [Salana multivorans]ROR97853.1 phage r1t holin [Salana multivorans]
MPKHALVRPRWYAAAGVRALKTAAQTAVALIGTTAVGVTDIAWPGVASAAALAGILSVLTSLGGLPEVDDTETAASSVGD